MNRFLFFIVPVALSIFIFRSHHTKNSVAPADPLEEQAPVRHTKVTFAARPLPATTPQPTAAAPAAQRAQGSPSASSSTAQLTAPSQASQQGSIPVAAPMARTQASVSPTDAHKAATHGIDPADTKLLQANIARAHAEGSRVAYVGGVQDLATFDPRFFEKFRNENGQMDVRTRRVDSVQEVATPQGSSKMTVERVPYPLPPGHEADYALLDRAIVRATDDGALLINLTTAGVDRSRLTDSIQYARQKGAVVVNVNPTAK